MDDTPGRKVREPIPFAVLAGLFLYCWWVAGKTGSPGLAALNWFMLAALAPPLVANRAGSGSPPLRGPEGMRTFRRLLLNLGLAGLAGAFLAASSGGDVICSVRDSPQGMDAVTLSVPEWLGERTAYAPVNGDSPGEAARKLCRFLDDRFGIAISEERMLQHVGPEPEPVPEQWDTWGLPPSAYPDAILRVSKAYSFRAFLSLLLRHLLALAGVMLLVTTRLWLRQRGRLTPWTSLAVMGLPLVWVLGLSSSGFGVAPFMEEAPAAVSRSLDLLGPLYMSLYAVLLGAWYAVGRSVSRSIESTSGSRHDSPDREVAA